MILEMALIFIAALIAYNAIAGFICDITKGYGIWDGGETTEKDGNYD